MNNILITLKKEIKSFLRDKKTLASLFIYPLLIPAMIILYGFLYDSLDEETIDYNVGVNFKMTETASNIFDAMGLNIVEKDSIEDLEKALDDNEINLYLTYDNEIKKYTIYAKTGSTDGMIAYESVAKGLEAYSESLTKEYLVKKGINIEEAYHQFDVELVELSSNNFLISIVYAVCFMYVVMSIVIVASNVAVSSTAAEKENGTLETILTFPISTTELIIGKYLSSVFLGFIASVFSILCLIIGLLVGKNFFITYQDLSLSINAGSIISSIMLSIITSFFIAGVSFFLTAKSKSFKEAQSKVGIVNMLTIIPMFVNLMGIPVSLQYYLIPICNSVQILNDMFLNNLSYLNLIVCMASNVIYGCILVFLVVKTYKQEKVLFTN